MQYQNNPNASKLKVINKNLIKIKTLQGPANPRYKTTLCKKFSSGQTCPYGDKCQFAHGQQELRLYSGQNMVQNMALGGSVNNKQQNNMINYKIVKCKNWEKDRTCKYGAHCTFAHGDGDLRNKADNLYQMNNSFNMMPMFVQPGVDMNQMQQIMLSNQLMMGMGMNPGFQNPNMTQGKNDVTENK